MLSYRHEFHAGNRADVFKHSVLFSFLNIFTQNKKPFTAFDLNAGKGIYNLLSDWSLQTGEAEIGILYLLNLYENQKLPEPIPQDLKLYLDYCKKNYTTSKIYAGSPEIIRSFLNPKSELILTELQSDEYSNLKQLYKGVKNIHIHKRDCYEAFKALTPPEQKRGFALFDPSYEVTSDYNNIEITAEQVLKKWNTCKFIIWYPVIKRRFTETEKLKENLSLSAYSKNIDIFNIEINHKPVHHSESSENGYGLIGSGIIIINPPWGLKEKIEQLADYYISLKDLPDL